MRGQVVVVKSFTGPLVRRVWEVMNGVVFVVTDDRLAELEHGNGEVPFIGFPLADVYEMDASEAVPQSPNWSQMRHWRPTAGS